MRDDTTILDTIAGSHLYGLAHEGSDVDYFRVVFRRHRTKQVVRDGVDSTEMGLDRFLENVYTGAHQSVEALFSTRKRVHPHYEQMFANYRVQGTDAFDKYLRTVVAFAHHDELKRRRHSVRLAINLRALKMHGRFDPTLTDEQKMIITYLTEKYQGFELVEAISRWMEV